MLRVVDVLTIIGFVAGVLVAVAAGFAIGWHARSAVPLRPTGRRAKGRVDIA